MDVAELEGTSAETKATYEKIKKYVAEHNLPKSEDSRQPQCPKEKEEAIVEALKAFQMI